MSSQSTEETERTWLTYYERLQKDGVSEPFDKVFTAMTYTHTWHNSVRVICKYARIQADQCVLDAGGGWGRLALGVLQRYPELDLTLLDLSAAALRLSRAVFEREGCALPAHHVAAPLEQLPFPDAHFDAVFSGRVFQHLADPSAAVGELLRVLKPGGRFVLFLQNRWCPLNRDYYARCYSPAEVRVWFDSNPVASLTVHSMDFYPGKLAALPLGLRMTIESTIERIPLLNFFGGKVIAYGER